MSTEIFEFSIAGDKHFDKALAVAMCDLFSESKKIELHGYRELDGALLLYTKLYGDSPNVILFPAPIADPTELIVSWLRNQEWSTSGQYGDVIYHRGYRIYNKGLPYESSLAFAVRPHWTEYHK